VQKAGRILQAHYPRIVFTHGAEHVLSLLFQDVFKFPILSTLSKIVKKTYILFGSGAMHSPHTRYSKSIQELITWTKKNGGGYSVIAYDEDYKEEDPNNVEQGNQEPRPAIWGVNSKEITTNQSIGQLIYKRKKRIIIIYLPAIESNCQINWSNQQ
jgi:hypothetical protein